LKDFPFPAANHKFFSRLKEYLDTHGNMGTQGTDLRIF
jgi:hypothetical protein